MIELPKTSWYHNREAKTRMLPTAAIIKVGILGLNIGDNGCVPEILS